MLWGLFLWCNMEIIRSKNFKSEKAWGAKDIASMNGVTSRLHWTDEPYIWHINDGEEIFAVMDGRVEMKYREKDQTIKSIADSYNMNPTSVSQISRRLERQFEEFKKKAQLDI